MTDKKTLRKIFASFRKAFPPEVRAANDRAVCARIRRLPEYRDCRALALYATDGTEPDLLPLMRDPGRIFLFPRYRKDAGVYEFAEVRSAEDLVPGKYGLPEPGASCTAAPEKLLKFETLYLVPGVAFDLAGVRLGRGGGFYDRLLEGGCGPVCGVYYSCQCSPELLPREPHDRKMDMVVSELFTIRWK